MTSVLSTQDRHVHSMSINKGYGHTDASIARGLERRHGRTKLLLYWYNNCKLLLDVGRQRELKWLMTHVRAEIVLRLVKASSTAQYFNRFNNKKPLWKACCHIVWCFFAAQDGISA